MPSLLFLECHLDVCERFAVGDGLGTDFSLFEGRRVTEALAAILCVNFIISSGFVKTSGVWLLTSQGVGEQWMPFMVAVLFFPYLCYRCGCWSSCHLPSPEDQIARPAPRVRMTPADCKALFIRYAPGLILLVAVYLVLTVVRDLRDNFAVEIWKELGYGGKTAILTTAEVPIALFSLLAVGALMFVRSNFKAFWLNHALGIAGALLLIGSTFLFQGGFISGLIWMIIFRIWFVFALYFVQRRAFRPTPGQFSGKRECRFFDVHGRLYRIPGQCSGNAVAQFRSRGGKLAEFLHQTLLSGRWNLFVAQPVVMAVFSAEKTILAIIIIF